jgi:iron complex outermembrane receptor protein
VTGLEGIISDSWSYDASFMHGQTNSNTAYINDFFGPRIQIAIGAAGVEPCTGTCIPYQVFKYNGVTAAAADNLKGTGILKGVTTGPVIRSGRSNTKHFRWLHRT